MARRKPTSVSRPSTCRPVCWRTYGAGTASVSPRHAVVEYRGAPVERVTTGWKSVVRLAGLDTDIRELKVVPHTLRHTAISWLLGAGVHPHQVSDYCGVSEQIIRKVYKHHLPGGFDNVLASTNELGRTSVPVSHQKQRKQT